MKTVFYLSDHSFRVITAEYRSGRFNVSASGVFPIPSGLMVGGAVQDPDALAAELSSALLGKRIAPKSAGIILDCPGIFAQPLDVPAASEKELFSVIENELSTQLSTYQEPLCDYFVLEPSLASGGGRVVAIATEKYIVKGLLDVFKKLDIKPEFVDTGLSSVVRLVDTIYHGTKDSFVISVLDSGALVSFLFSDGKYRLFKTTNLYETRGTPASAVEISRALSSIIQFNTAQAGSSPINCAYICGMSDEEKGYCGDISSLLEIQVGPLPDSVKIRSKPPVSLGDFLYCFGALV